MNLGTFISFNVDVSALKLYYTALQLEELKINLPPFEVWRTQAGVFRFRLPHVW